MCIILFVFNTKLSCTNSMYSESKLRTSSKSSFQLISLSISYLAIRNPNWVIRLEGEKIPTSVFTNTANNCVLGRQPMIFLKNPIILDYIIIKK